VSERDGRGASKRERVSASDRREQYLKVAGDLVTAHGIDAVTMEAVAAGVGVNKALLYRQFSNRGELLLALYRRVTSDLDRRIVEAVDGHDTFEARVRAWVHAWFDFIAVRGRLMYRLQHAGTVADQVERPHRARQRRNHARYGSWYADHLGLSEEIGRDAAAIITASLAGVSERWAESPNRATRDRLEETYIAMVLGGLERLADQHPDGWDRRNGQRGLRKRSSE